MFHLLKKPGIDSGCLFRFESPIPDSQETFTLDISSCIYLEPDSRHGIHGIFGCVHYLDSIDLAQIEEIL